MIEIIVKKDALKIIRETNPLRRDPSFAEYAVMEWMRADCYRAVSALKPIDMKKIGEIEEKGGSKNVVPVVIVKKKSSDMGQFVYVKCPFCGKEHRHGKGIGTIPGFRGSHCEGENVEKRGVYYITYDKNLEGCSIEYGEK